MLPLFLFASSGNPKCFRKNHQGAAPEGESMMATPVADRSWWQRGRNKRGLIKLPAVSAWASSEMQICSRYVAVLLDQSLCVSLDREFATGVK